MQKPLIQLQNVSYQYDEQSNPALNDISLNVYESEWLAIVGHNGSGKSTLAKLLNGLQFPQKGTIHVLVFHYLKILYGISDEE